MTRTVQDSHLGENGIARNAFEPALVTGKAVQVLREREGLSLTEAKSRLLLENEAESFRRLMTDGGPEDKIDWLLARFAEMRGYPETGN